MLIGPDSPICKIFQDGLGIVPKQATELLLGIPITFEPYNAPPSPQNGDAFSQTVLSGASLMHKSKLLVSSAEPNENTLI